MDIIDELRHQIQVHCTGPCAPSSSVMHQIARTREVLQGAIDTIGALRTALAHPCRFADPPCGRCEACAEIDRLLSRTSGGEE